MLNVIKSKNNMQHTWACVNTRRVIYRLVTGGGPCVVTVRRVVWNLWFGTCVSTLFVYFHDWISVAPPASFFFCQKKKKQTSLITTSPQTTTQPFLLHFGIVQQRREMHMERCKNYSELIASCKVHTHCRKRRPSQSSNDIFNVPMSWLFIFVVGSLGTAQ